MKSTAQIKGHPLHPILIVFPIAFFTGTFLFDLLAVFTANANMALTAGYLNIAGIIGAALAAVPGIVDYIYTVPPKSSGKKRAAKHGIINVVVLLLFSFLLWYRYNATDPQVQVIVLLGATGVTLLMIAGWMGGTLVHRNQIGVDIRYASAGKWNEAYIGQGAMPARVAEANELQLNQMKLVHIQGKRIVIGKTEDGYTAFDDYCTHRGGSLAGGSLICGTVQCPWHGSQFDVKTGAAKCGPAHEKINIYRVYEKEGAVWLQL